MFKGELFIFYYTNLEDLVKKTYYSMGILEPSEINMFSVANYLNINLRFWDEPSEAVEIDGKYWIFINENLSPEEQWQDFAHELCHVLQHEGYQRSMPMDFRLYQEAKSDNFMYHFCIPTFMLDAYEFPYYHGQAIDWIAHDFNVTTDFARERFYMYLDKQFSLKFDKEFRHSLVAEQRREYTTEVREMNESLHYLEQVEWLKAKLKNLSLIAGMTNDVNWQHELCNELDQLNH